MISEIGRKLNWLFENSGDSEYRFDRACMLLCEYAQAASASILLYSSLEDQLKCAGRCINPARGKIDGNGQPYQDRVLRNMCACEFLDTKNVPASVLINDAHASFTEFKETALAQNQTTEADFTFLLEKHKECRKLFESIKQAYRHESIDIGKDVNSISGSWYKGLLSNDLDSPADLLVKHLRGLDDARKYGCLGYLEEALEFTFEPQFYVALPLTAGGRTFGILRFLFPEDDRFIDTGETEGADPQLNKKFKETLIDITQALSLRLKLDYFIQGQISATQMAHKLAGETRSFKGHLNAQCDILTDIGFCKGAIIRKKDNITGNHKIIGNSRMLEAKLDAIQNNDHNLFKKITGRFETSTSILCIYFNCAGNTLETKEYTYRDSTGKFKSTPHKTDLSELEQIELAWYPAQEKIAHIAVFPLPHATGHYMVFYNSENRRFRDEDIGRVFPVLKTLGLFLKEQENLKETQRRIEITRDMHREISAIFENKERTAYEYVTDFLDKVTNTIDKLRLFPHYIIWECISEKGPQHHPLNSSYCLRDVTPQKYKKGPVKSTGQFKYPKDEYLNIALPRDDFENRLVQYFRNETLEEVFKLELQPGYNQVSIPVFPDSSNNRLPQWILTFIYESDDTSRLHDKEFFQFIENLSHQIGLAWDKFQETISTRLKGAIDFQLGSKTKTRGHTTTGQLQVISKRLARELKVDWCGIFLLNESSRSLSLEAANVELTPGPEYMLDNNTGLIAECFNRNEGLRLFSRESIEEYLDTEKLKMIEKGLRGKQKKKKGNHGKHRPTPYVSAEHALFVPISMGENQLGVIGLLRTKGIGKPDTPSRFNLKTPPFSEFNSRLMRKLQRHVYNIFTSHYAVQKRMRDIRSVMNQVIRPINMLIASREKATAGNPISLAKIANNYARNFETLLNIDTNSFSPRIEPIPDLRQYLINQSMIYQQLIFRTKRIHLNVTRKTGSNIALDADIKLLDVAFNNILDNAVKYSYSPDERVRLGLQYEPGRMTDPENILIDAEQEENGPITITISNCGIPISSYERKHLFDREFQGEEARERFPEGTGIGLFLAREIIKRHHGDIHLMPPQEFEIGLFSKKGEPRKTARGHKTVFEITFPGGIQQ